MNENLCLPLGEDVLPNYTDNYLFYDKKYADFKPEEVEDSLKEVGECAEALVKLQHYKEQLESYLKTLNRQIEELSSYFIPKLMSNAGLRDFTLESGAKVTCKETLFASLPKEDPKARTSALNWINEHGGGSIIKDTVNVESPSPELLSLLEGKFAYERKQDIHPATLKSFMSELLGYKKNAVAQLDVEEVPPELHLFIKKETKISN